MTPRLDIDGKPIPRSSRPKLPGVSPVALIKDQVGLPVIIGVGCLLQLAASYTPFWYLPSLLLVAAPCVKNVMIYYRLLDNPYTENIVLGRVSATVPRNFRDGLLNEEFAVLHLGFRTNSPLGLLDPAAKVVGSTFGTMMKELESNPEEYGFLHVENYLGAKRATQNTLMNVFYFESYEHILKFSASIHHMKGWKEYFAMTEEQQAMVEIWHEGFVVSKADSIYGHAEPIGMSNMWQRNELSKSEGGGADVPEYINGLHAITKKSRSRVRMG